MCKKSLIISILFDTFWYSIFDHRVRESFMCSWARDYNPGVMRRAKTS